MTSLPSFVELMATLGLESKQDSTSEHSSSPFSSPSCSPRLSVTAPSPTHTRSRSNPNAREASIAMRARSARFSPYAPNNTSGRRGSTASASDFEPPNRALSSSPRSRRLRRIASAHLTVNVYDSASDLSANTPISSYVRRKTPGGSPTGSIFSSHSSNSSSRNESPSHSPSLMPFSIPTLPTLIPRSPNSDVNFPLTPDATVDNMDGIMQTPPAVNGKGATNQFQDSPSLRLTKPLPEMSDAPFIRRSFHSGSLRLATPPPALSMLDVRQ
ncbi:hypothetical protein DL96DRAFT_1703741 [Flagelloscypha sp. PMI_526]|nr:hypothetical protein DL96DRAFT_1703741 [Flagelloscypha sp. PMI_526]